MSANCVDGVVVYKDKPVNQAALEDLAGMNVATVSKLLKELARNDMIRIERNDKENNFVVL